MAFDPDFIAVNLQTDNETESKDFFENRLFYKSAAFDDIPIKPIDTWEEKPFYGLVDLKHYPVYTSRSGSIVTTENPDVKCLDFVNDAFVAMKNFWYNLQIHDRIESESLLNELRPVKGWQNLIGTHQAYIEAQMLNFINFITSNDLSKKMRNLDDFIALFNSYLKSLDGVALSRSSFVLSNAVSILSSGLCIEFLDYDYADDSIKYDEVIADSNFIVLGVVARKFGFRIDKNIPWRLVADIGSKEMQEFMKARQILGGSESQIKKNLFSYKFNKVYEGEIDFWRKILVSTYNSFVLDNPILITKEFEQSKRHSALSSKTKIYRRQPVDENNLPFRYNDRYWLNIYINIRNKETKKFKDSSRLRYFKNQVNRMVKKGKKGLDISKALMYTEHKMKVCLRLNYNPVSEYTTEELELLEQEYLSFISTQ